MSNSTSFLIKLFALIGIISAVTFAVILICKKKSSKSCQCAEAEDEAEKDFGECCDACYSDTDE